MTNAFYVYMMTNRSRVVLYTGITNSLAAPITKVLMTHSMPSLAKKKSKAAGAAKRMRWSRRSIQSGPIYLL
jgi:predicted GIY-YIG superfamily endonuclease